jgi:hypothetical protein
MRKKTRLVAALSVVLLTLAACGQYKGVHEAGLKAGQVGGIGNGGGTDTGTGGTDTGTGGTDTPTGGTGTGGTGTTGGTGGTGGGTGGGPSGGGLGGPGNATGVTATTITIGIHAPLTNAGIKGESFNAGKDLYWKRGAGGGPVKIHGRTVKVVFANDEYNPSKAVSECKKMSTKTSGAFLLIGGGGTDQVAACGRYANLSGIPYLSAGVTEAGLKKYKTYFALSMSYAQQAPLVAQYIKKVLGVTDPSRVAAVITDTGNFDDAYLSFKNSFPNVQVFRPGKSERGSQMGPNLCTGSVKKFDVVFPLTAPAYYLEMAGNAACKPQYVGVGVTMGLDEVASIGCSTGRGTENARFLSPSPSFESARTESSYADFMSAAQAEGIQADDLVFLLWGLSKTLHQLLEKAGPNLTRQGFVASTETASVSTGVYPPLKFSASNHFGANQAHVLKNVCQSRGDLAGYYVTERKFVSGF